MKKFSIFYTFIFVIGMMGSAAFAQTQCISDVDCDDGISCNGIETCDVDNSICLEGVSPCAENEICDPDNDICVSANTTIAVDIKPGSCPNPMNVRSRGVLPVAILGTEEFDVTAINPETILLTREGFEGIPAIRYGYEDVGMPSEGEPCDCNDPEEDDLNEDGYLDLILKFRVPELVDGLGLKEIESREIIPLTIMGESDDGTLIMGEDCILVINWFKWWQDKMKKSKKPGNRGKK